MDTAATMRLGYGRQAWNFVQHFLEMCISMCAGGYPLYLLLFTALPAVLGGPDFRERAPELSLVVIATLLTLPMAAWMRFRGMEWRPIVEMSAVPFGVAIILIGAVSVGVAPGDTLLIKFGSFCGLSCVGMFLVMLPRLDMYTGRTGHHMQHATHAS